MRRPPHRRLQGRPLARAALALWAVGLLAGCPGRFARPDDFSPDPAPFIAAVAARNAAVRSLTGALQLEVWQGADRIRLKQLFAVQAPDKLRLSALTPFGQPLTELVSDGRVLAIWDQEARRFFEGVASAENLARLVPVPLAPEALSALLRGSVPLLADAESAEVTWDAAEGWHRLVMVRGPTEAAISFEPEHRRVVALRVREGGRVQLEARLGRYDGADPRTAMPRRLRLEAPGADARVDVEVVEVSLNPALPDAVFTLEPPRGIEVERL